MSFCPTQFTEKCDHRTEDRAAGQSLVSDGPKTGAFQSLDSFVVFSCLYSD